MVTFILAPYEGSTKRKGFCKAYVKKIAFCHQKSIMKVAFNIAFFVVMQVGR